MQPLALQFRLQAQGKVADRVCRAPVRQVTFFLPPAIQQPMQQLFQQLMQQLMQQPMQQLRLRLFT